MTTVFIAGKGEYISTHPGERRMSNLMAGACTGLIAVALAACGAPTDDIADISVVTRLPKEVGAGGFQTTLEEDGIAAGYFYQATISDCESAVLDTARAWADRHGWTEGEAQVEARSAMLRLRPPGDTATAFVIRYSLASDRSLARVRITREAGAGGRESGPVDPSGLAAAELIRGELRAAQCEAGG